MTTLLIDIARLTLWLTLLALMFAPLEHFFGRTRRVGARAVATDLGFYYLNGLLPTLLLAAPLATLAALAQRVLPADYLAAIAVIPGWALLLIGLFVAEIGSYWAHRACHASPFLWRFHAIHHTPTHIDWLVNTRAHPLDTAFTRLGGLAPLYLLGLSRPGEGMGETLPVLVTLIGALWSFLVHANVRWRFGRLEQLVALPAFHHWHHTNDAHRDRNFAAMFPVIDRMFGTLHLPASWPPVYGIDEPVEGSLAGQLLHPLTAGRSGRPREVASSRGARP